MTTIEQAADGSFRIGAAVSGMALHDHENFGKVWPGVLEAVNLIGSKQVQGRASAGGNLCNGSPAADSVPAMIAAGALCALSCRAPTAERELPRSRTCITPGPARHPICQAGRDHRGQYQACRRACRSRGGDAYLTVYSAHGDGHRRGRRRREPDDRRSGVCTVGARRARRRCADTALLVPKTPRRRSSAGRRSTKQPGKSRGRLRQGRLPSDRRQARHGIAYRTQGFAGVLVRRAAEHRGRACDAEKLRSGSNPDGPQAVHVHDHRINGEAGRVPLRAASDTMLGRSPRRTFHMTGSRRKAARRETAGRARSTLDGRQSDLLLPGSRCGGRGCTPSRTIEGMANGRYPAPVAAEVPRAWRHSSAGSARSGFLVASEVAARRGTPNPSEHDVRLLARWQPVSVYRLRQDRPLRSSKPQLSMRAEEKQDAAR